MSVVTAKRTTGTNHEHFLQYICTFVYSNMWMLAFNVVPGYQGLLFRDFLRFCFFFSFFFSIRPTDPISEDAFDAKRKKKGGMPLMLKKRFSEWKVTQQSYSKMSVKIPVSGKNSCVELFSYFEHETIVSRGEIMACGIENSGLSKRWALELTYGTKFSREFIFADWRFFVFCGN